MSLKLEMCSLVTKNKTSSEFILCRFRHRHQYTGAAQCLRQQQNIATTVALLATRAPIVCCNGANTWNTQHWYSER